MKNIFPSMLFVSVLGVSNPLSAQAALSPCDAEVTAGYRHELDKFIDDAIKQAPQLSLTVMPSFFPEYGIRLVGDKVYYVELKASYWGNNQIVEVVNGKLVEKPYKKIKTKVYEAALDPALGARMQEIYKTAIVNTKPAEMMGLDGISYSFSLPSGECGETWSPEKASPNGKLVVLLELLVSHAQLSSARGIKRSEKSISQFLASIDGKQ